MLRLALPLLLGGLAAELLLAHTFHFAAAEVNWKVASGAEITLKFHTEDLEQQLREAAGRNLEIDRDPAAKELACQFARKHFSFVPALPTMKCLGMEVSNHFTNVYLEASWTGKKPVPQRIRLSAFQAVFADQKNSVVLFGDGKPMGNLAVGPKGWAEVPETARRTP